MTSADSAVPSSAVPEEPVVHQEIHIEAPPDAVFDFFVVPEKMARWMGSDVQLNPHPGGKFQTSVTEDDTAMGQFVEVDRPHRIQLSWGWKDSDVVPPGASLVTVDFRPEGNGTRVVLTHTGLDEEQCTLHAEGWSHFLPLLDSAAAGSAT